MIPLSDIGRQIGDGIRILFTESDSERGSLGRRRQNRKNPHIPFPFLEIVTYDCGGTSMSRPGGAMQLDLGSTQNRDRRRLGTAAVELAVVAPFVIILLVGLLEVGRMVQVNEIVSNAAREGARKASTGINTYSDVQTTVANYLTNAGITNQTGLTVTVYDVTQGNSGPTFNPSTAVWLDQLQVTRVAAVQQCSADAAYRTPSTSGHQRPGCLVLESGSSLPNHHRAAGRKLSQRDVVGPISKHRRGALMKLRTLRFLRRRGATVVETAVRAADRLDFDFCHLRLCRGTSC